MTVSSTTSRNQYTATSGQTVFPYSFEIFDKDDVAVLQNGTLLSEGTNYTVSGVGNNSGGNITLVVGATAGDVLTIYRDMAYQRLTDYQNSGDFLAQEVNDDFDRLWLAVQQNEQGTDRAIVKPITDAPSIDMTLPSATSRANSFLTFDLTGAVTTTPLASPLSPSVIARQKFTGNGSTTVFTLAADPGSPAAVVIYIDGVYQEEGTYSITGTTLTFTEEPPVNAGIEVVSYKVSAIGTTDANSVTYTPAGTGAVQTSVQSKLRETVSVKDFGAVGDGVTDDTAAIQAALNTQKPIILEDGANYKITNTLTAYNSITGKATITLDASSTNCIEITSRSEFEFSKFSIISTNTSDLFSNVAQGIEINSCSNFKIDGLSVTYFTDGISVSTSDAFIIENNKIKEIGQELIAVRYCAGWSVINNYGYHHNGDGILIKGNALHGGLIEGNTVKLGVNTYGYAVKGGGITCNLEGGDITAIRGLTIANNIVSETSYGISLVAPLFFTITGNKILDLVDGKGIDLVEATTYNPNSVPGGRGVISNNVISNIADDEGIRVRLDGTVTNLPCIISNNFVDIVNSIQNCINAQGCVVSNNMTRNGRISLTAEDCVIEGNIFQNTASTADAGIKLFGNTVFANNLMNGWNNYIQVRADFDGSITGNVISTTSSQAAITILSGAKGSASDNNIVNSGAGPSITQFDGLFSIDRFTQRRLAHQIRTAAPTAGTWQLGDFVWNAAPGVDANSMTILGWVCVTAGTPGTWVATRTSTVSPAV
jgi:hypothetical protein